MNEPATSLTVSVIIPVFNGGDDLEKCLSALFRSDFPFLECIVVDDASTDGRTQQIAERHGARVLVLDRQGGPAIARNRGAREARGDVLFFTDADVVLHADAITRAVAEFQANPGVAAVIGSYDEHPVYPSFLSRYRNLYHYWNHQTANPEASTFWTGCGAVRKHVLLELGGFSQEYGKPSIEDIEFGYRLRANGYRIRLLRDMQGSHLKQWTLSNIIKTDIFQRGVPWIVLLKRFPDSPPDLNLKSSARVATALAGLFLLSLLLLLPGHPLSLPAWPWGLMPLLAVVGIAWIQRDFLRLVSRLHGPGYTLATVPMQVLFFICCGVAVPLGYLAYWKGERQSPSVPIT